MNLKSALIKLYYLLVHVDGVVNDREEAAGTQMIKTEGISEPEFISALELLKKRTASNIYAECIEDLRKLNHQNQVRCIAWLCAVANADGFMDKTEWQFIYKVYHKELNLNLDEVMKVQKELVGLTFKKSLSLSPIL